MSVRHQPAADDASQINCAESNADAPRPARKPVRSLSVYSARALRQLRGSQSNQGSQRNRSFARKEHCSSRGGEDGAKRDTRTYPPDKNGKYGDVRWTLNDSDTDVQGHVTSVGCMSLRSQTKMNSCVGSDAKKNNSALSIKSAGVTIVGVSSVPVDMPMKKYKNGGRRSKKDVGRSSNSSGWHQHKTSSQELGLQNGRGPDKGSSNGERALRDEWASKKDLTSTNDCPLPPDRSKHWLDNMCDTVRSSCEDTIAERPHDDTNHEQLALDVSNLAGCCGSTLNSSALVAQCCPSSAMLDTSILAVSCCPQSLDISGVAVSCYSTRTKKGRSDGTGKEAYTKHREKGGSAKKRMNENISGRRMEKAETGSGECSMAENCSRSKETRRLASSRKDDGTEKPSVGKEKCVFEESGRVGIVVSGYNTGLNANSACAGFDSSVTTSARSTFPRRGTETARIDSQPHTDTIVIYATTAEKSGRGDSVVSADKLSRVEFIQSKLGGFVGRVRGLVRGPGSVGGDVVIADRTQEEVDDDQTSGVYSESSGVRRSSGAMSSCSSDDNQRIGLPRERTMERIPANEKERSMSVVEDNTPVFSVTSSGSGNRPGSIFVSTGESGKVNRANRGIGERGRADGGEIINCVAGEEGRGKDVGGRRGERSGRGTGVVREGMEAGRRDEERGRGGESGGGGIGGVTVGGVTACSVNRCYLLSSSSSSPTLFTTSATIYNKSTTSSASTLQHKRPASSQNCLTHYKREPRQRNHRHQQQRQQLQQHQLEHGELQQFKQGQQQLQPQAPIRRLFRRLSSVGKGGGKFNSFVSSQEWTLSRSVPDLKLGIVGTCDSGKSALVHRYLTGSYLQEESPEGGLFKKEMIIDGQSHLLLIRDEGGPPEMQWVDAVIFTFSLENEMSFNTLYSYYAKMSVHRNMATVPLVLVATQDAICDASPRLIDEARARKLASDLRCCAYYEACATYGLNVDRAFQEACWSIVQARRTNNNNIIARSSPTPSLSSTTGGGPQPAPRTLSRSSHPPPPVSSLAYPSGGDGVRGLSHSQSVDHSIVSSTTSVFLPIETGQGSSGTGGMSSFGTGSGVNGSAAHNGIYRQQDRSPPPSSTSSFHRQLSLSSASTSQVVTPTFDRFLRKNKSIEPHGSAEPIERASLTRQNISSGNVRPGSSRIPPSAGSPVNITQQQQKQQPKQPVHDHFITSSQSSHAPLHPARSEPLARTEPPLPARSSMPGSLAQRHEPAHPTRSSIPVPIAQRSDPAPSVRAAPPPPPPPDTSPLSTPKLLRKLTSSKKATDSSSSFNMHAPVVSQPPALPSPPSPSQPDPLMPAPFSTPQVTRKATGSLGLGAAVTGGSMVGGCGGPLGGGVSFALHKSVAFSERIVDSILRGVSGAGGQISQRGGAGEERAPLAPLFLSNRFAPPRHRSYSVQVLEQQQQSTGSTIDFSSASVTPNTTPTPARKSRRHSNIFARKDGDDKKVKNGGGTVDAAKVGVGRTIPVKQGYLYKRSNKPLSRNDWQKKYIALLDDGRLTYYPSIHDYMENVHCKELKLGRTTVKIPGQRPRGSEAKHQSTSSVPAVLKSQGGSEMSVLEVAGNGHNGIESGVVIQNTSVAPALPMETDIGSGGVQSTTVTNNNSSWKTAETPDVKKRHRRIKSSSKNIDVNLEGADGDGFEFVIVSLDNKQWHFEALTEEKLLIRENLKLFVLGFVPHCNNPLDELRPSFIRRMRYGCKSGAALSCTTLCSLTTADGYMITFKEYWELCKENNVCDWLQDRSEWVAAIQKQIMSSLQLNESNKAKSRSSSLSNAAVIQTIRSVPGNAVCADCASPNPEWASLNLGALICIECSGIHRNLGTHLSRVRSLELDEWPSELVQVMTAIGNNMVNRLWEANMGNRQKPRHNSSREDKDQWIRSKYERHEFLPDLVYKDVPIAQQLIDAVARQDIHDTILVLGHATPDDVNAPYNTSDTKTALHLAAAVGNIVLIQLLIWYGANVRQLDNEGLDAIYYAHHSGSQESVILLQLIAGSVQSTAQTTSSRTTPSPLLHL